jgi:hypothetical protein
VDVCVVQAAYFTFLANNASLLMKMLYNLLTQHFLTPVRKLWMSSLCGGGSMGWGKELDQVQIGSLTKMAAGNQTNY